MKPKLGRIVYCVYEWSILVQPVYALAKDSFLLDFHGGVFEDSIEWFFEDYNETWFTSLEKAKKKLLDDNKTEFPDLKFKIVKKADDYYELKEI